jgi:hypothetical protein
MIQEEDGMVATEWDCAWMDFICYREDWKDITEEDLKPLVEWCKEYQGVGRFYVDDLFGQFYFENDEDRAMFVLRWS